VLASSRLRPKTGRLARSGQEPDGGSDPSGFHIYLIKPTRYDDEGYPLQWLRSIIPSNSLACVTAIVEDSIARGVLGRDVVARTHPIDEVNSLIDPAAIVARMADDGGRALVFLIGVQSNQFPRAMDIARPFRAAGVPVCIGGFHVSGCLSMLKTMPPELVEAQALGISFFAGEAEEHRMDQVLRDGYADALQPIYDYLKDMPSLAGEPGPLLAREVVDRNLTSFSSFDLGRGCPFECSFCTIINVQGRKSRFRTADDLEAIVRANHAIGVTRFFLTDDNFARNRNWEAYADRLIHLAETEGMTVRLIIQVDTMAHRIPRFIDKMVQAGVKQIFIGLENINSDNLEAVKKRQNRIEEYREMFLDWKRHPVVIICGYIIGFPNDTKDSIKRDIEIVKRELPIDMLYLNFLTPLPGSEDHRKMLEAGEWMDPDINKYDLNHRVTHHARMSDRDWEDAYREALASFYTFEHMNRVLKRMVALGSNMKVTTMFQLMAYREAPRIEKVAMLESGLVRIKRRLQRRPGLPIENPILFHLRHAAHVARSLTATVSTSLVLRAMLWRALRDPKRFSYSDPAIRKSSEAQDALLRLTRDRSTPYAEKRQQRRQLSLADSEQR